MSAEDYGYSSYEEMFQHAAHHGGSVDADSNVVEFVAALIDTITAQAERIAALEMAVETARELLTTLDWNDWSDRADAWIAAHPAPVIKHDAAKV